MLAVDTNVLVYAHRREAREHPDAVRLLRHLAEGAVPWAIPWPCVYEFFSVVTNPRIWKERATPPNGAWDQIEAWLASPSLHLLGETEEFPAVLLHFLQNPRVRGPVVHDARVAALCIAHGVSELLSRDRDFSLFGDLAVTNPFI
jgi:toxin-antitoxin system PIN domain toxin